MTKPAKKLTAKKLAAFIQTTYNVAATGKMINIMDIGKVFRAGEAAYSLTGNTADVELAIRQQVELLCIEA